MDVSFEKILKLVKQINPLKALDRGGIQAIFYHKCWNIVGNSVSNMVGYIFNHSHMLKESVGPILLLFQKYDSLVNVNHYRAISFM